MTTSSATTTTTTDREAIDPSDFTTAMNAGEAAAAPEWVQLLPAGEKVAGRDRREWLVRSPQAIVDAFKRRQGPIIVDYEHAIEKRAPQGLDAPAAGWVNEMEVRDGAVWGKVDWTANAKERIKAREYRFLSPVVVYGKSDRNIVAIDSVGLVGRPNFQLHALNSENEQETAMDLKPVTDALGLQPDATVEAIATAVNDMKTSHAKALNEAGPTLDKYVPRADYDALKARAENAEKLVADAATAAHDAEVEASLNEATKAGKITPATRDYYKAQCATSEGLDAFKAFCSAAPVIADDTGLSGKDPADLKDPQAIARAANEYIKEQDATGVHVSMADAVHHVTKRQEGK